MRAINLIPSDKFYVREWHRCVLASHLSSANLHGRYSGRLLIVSYRWRRRVGRFGIWTERDTIQGNQATAA